MSSTKTDPKDNKIHSLTTCLYKLEKNEAFVLATAQRGGGNRTQTCTNPNTKGREPKNIYVEGLSIY